MNDQNIGLALPLQSVSGATPASEGSDPSCPVIEAPQAGVRVGAQSWARDLDAAIKGVAEEKAYFTADDVWEQLGDPTSHGAGSAMGPAMNRALKAGLLEPSGEYRRSIRPSTHGRPLPVWRSRTVGGGQIP